MKKIIIPFIALAGALGLVSCEDFLTKKPENALSPGTFFTTQTELDIWTNNFYSDLLPSPTSLAELTADDLGSASSLNAIQRGTLNPSSKTWTEDTWKPLRNINYMLENNKCQDPAISGRYEGVCYFFRAWFYFNMVRQYGDVPWYGHVIGSSDTGELNRPRDPRGFVMLRVMQDLDRAYELLPEKWPTDAVYHVSKDAALALKSRAALFEGTFRKYHAGSVYVPQDEQTFDGITISSEWFLRQAVDAAGKMLGKRSLYKGNTLNLAERAVEASYREYFLLEDAETDETILSRRYNVDLLVRHGIQFDYKNHRQSASIRFVNHYLKTDGQPIDYNSTLDYYDSFQGRDPRMAQTLHGPSYVALGESAHEPLMWDRTFNGYRIIKYISDSSHETATTSTTDFPVLRYAEVLLNYAEARAELGELTQDDLNKTINVIRARVGMPPMTMNPTVDKYMGDYYSNASGDQVILIREVRRERTVELFAEGFRQWDLLRWGEGEFLTPKATDGFQGIYFSGLGEFDLDRDGKKDICLYKGTKPSVSSTIKNENIIKIGEEYTLSDGESGYLTFYAAEDYVWNEGRDYLWPIPADQRTITGFALSQNPGWDDGLTDTTQP